MLRYLMHTVKIRSQDFFEEKKIATQNSKTFPNTTLSIKPENTPVAISEEINSTLPAINLSERERTVLRLKYGLPLQR